MEIKQIPLADILLQNLIQRQADSNANSNFSLSGGVLNPDSRQESSFSPQNDLISQDNFLQNSIFINETFRNLTDPSTSANSLLINETPVNIAASGILDNLPAIQQNELFINDNLFNLNFNSDDSVNSLLIDEIAPSLVADNVFQNLNLVQENALSISENLQDINIISIDDEFNFLRISSPQTPIDLNNPSDIQNIIEEEQALISLRDQSPFVATVPENLAAAVVGTPEDEGVSVNNAQNVVSNPLPQTPVTTEQTPVTSAFNPADMPFLQGQDRTNLVFRDFENREQNQRQTEVSVPNRTVQPVTQIERTRAIDQLVLSQGQTRENRREPDRNDTEQVLPVTSIKHLLKIANDDLIGRGSPIHLVLAQSQTGLALDVYDCSFPDQCVLKHDIPLQIGELPKIVERLSTEAGIIIDVSS